MITAGIDVGAKTIKVVLLKNGQILSKSLVMGGLDTNAAIEEAMKAALAQAKITRQEIAKCLATGTGRKDCPFANGEVTDVTAATNGILHILPSCRTIIDVGAEEGRTARISNEGKVIDFAYNEKCAAGAGTFAESMARAIEVPLTELGPLSLKSTTPVQMNAQCAVFAESEVVSLVHAKTPSADIARAVLDAIASRIISMVRKVGFEKDVALIGGMTLNIGFVEAMKRGLEMEITVPEDSEYIGALGAALLAVK